ncbi:Phosphatidylinositol-4-phosphate 5-kinase, partial [Podila epigama]
MRMMETNTTTTTSTTDTTNGGFYSDLFDHGNGVYSSPNVVEYHPKHGLQKVSEGTQTGALSSPSPPSSPTPKREDMLQTTNGVHSHHQPHHDYDYNNDTHTNTTLPHQKQYQQQQQQQHHHQLQQQQPLQHEHQNLWPSQQMQISSIAPKMLQQQKLNTPSTPPRISSLTPPLKGPTLASQQQYQQHQQQQQHVHSENTLPPRFTSLHSQPISSPHLLHNDNGDHLHSHHPNQFAQGFSLEPSPTLSATETSTFKASSLSSPASSISDGGQPHHSQPPLQNHTSTPVSFSSSSSSSNAPASASVSASTPFAPADTSAHAHPHAPHSPPRTTSTTATSSPAPSPTSRPRPSSYAPIKLNDVSSTVANMTTLAALPIPATVTSSSSTSSSSTTPIPAVAITSATVPVFEGGQDGATYEQQQYYMQQQQQQHHHQQQQQQQPFAPRSPASVVSSSTATIAGAAGAGGGYQHTVTSAKQSPSKFATPTRASTMDVRKLQSGSLLLGEGGVSTSSRISQQQHQLQQTTYQQDPQAESSSRAKRRQIYRRNTYSADLASASFHRSDDEMEMDDLEEAKRRMEALKKSSSRRMSKRKKDKDEDNDRVLIGTRIGEDHVNYVLMYNMLTGIRVSVSRCNAKPQRALVDEDFTSAHKLAFDITGNELTPSSKYDFKFKDYAPWVFRHLREDFHIDASDYL